MPHTAYYIINKMSPLKKFLIISAVIIFGTGSILILVVKATTTNIDSTSRYAWSDISGWWDFYDTDTVVVGTSSLSGYASSSIGDIALDCHTTRNGNVCATADFQVTNLDGGGELAGCAWNDAIGWIGFSCKDGDCNGSLTPDASSTCAGGGNWGVTIDSSGVFSGSAWNDIEGFVSFNGNPTSSYKVATSWRPGRMSAYLESSVIDTSVASGTILNNIIWNGTKPSNTLVDFQVAVSNSSGGPWSFFGPGGDTGAYYGSSCPSVGAGNSTPGTPICVDRGLVTNYRYLKYRIRMQSDTAQSQTPTITDIVLNWSL